MMMEQLLIGANSRTLIFAVYQVLTDLFSSLNLSKSLSENDGPEEEEVSRLARRILDHIRGPGDLPDAQQHSANPGRKRCESRGIVDPAGLWSAITPVTLASQGKCLHSDPSTLRRLS